MIKHDTTVLVFKLPNTIWTTHSGNSYKYIVADKQYKWAQSYINEKERDFFTG